MKRFWSIVLCVLSVVPLIAQEDYYFTLLDHWNWKGPNTYVPTNLKKCAVSLSAAEDVDFTFSTPVNNGQTSIRVNQGNNSVVLIDDVDAAILNGVSIHSSGASSVNINIIGTTSAAETAILPKRLLGTKYMLQGAPGLLVDNLPVYSQFTIVGVENGSSISVKPRVAMTCVTTGANVPAGQVSTFQINEKQVLLFQPTNYEDEISGTIVESNNKIAVFQGNNITRIPVTANWSDFVYEQARPISSFGKEFIIPKASGLMICDWKIIAAEDNTEVYIYSNGSKVKHGVKNAGEWFTKTIYSASSDLQVDHIVTSKPVCCYLYMTGSSSNNSKGDPEMIEIVPVDKMAKTARWGKAQTNDNSPHTISLLVTAPQADETKVQYNSQPLSSYATQSGVQRVVIDGFVVYQIPFATANGVLQSAGEGFSAHIIHYAQTAEGTGYNVSLPEEMPEPADLCMDGTLLFREDFGGNNPSDPKISTTPVPGMSYTQATTDVLGSMGAGKYLVTKQGYCNGNGTSQWHLQDDHTHFGDLTRGYFMEIDGRAGSDAFYQTTIDHLCEGIELTFSAYVANVMTWGMYVGRPGMYAYPRLKFVLTDPTSNTELATYDTGDIPFDSTFIGDNMCWQQSVEWRLVGMNFIVPVGVESVQLSIYNNVSNSNGNDFAIDDIEVHLCMTPDTIRTDTTVCDTLSQIQWRDKIYNIADTLRDTIFSSCGFDSIYYELRVSTEHCCQSSNGLHGFSVSASKQVLFAPGNLQYNATLGTHLCADGTTQQGSWRFAEHQWDVAEQKLYYHTYMYDGWIDLFAWGTSGWSDGVEEYQPWSMTKGYPDVYYINGDATLSMVGEYKNADWAVYNAIGDDAPDTWRTLAADEWNYILNQRKNASLLCGKATVNDIHGLVFLPDDYPMDDSSLPEFIPGSNRYCETNTYTENEWIQLENKGAVFLPAAGNLYVGNINFPNEHGHYWSATASKENILGRADDLEFYCGVTYPPTQVTPEDRRGGKSVRPVWDIPKDYIPSMEVDTTICDTLLPFTWMGIEWKKANVIRDTLQSVCGTDSICLILSLNTEICCPNVIVQNYDTVVCDTLMPYRWCDTLFTESATFEIICKDNRGCDSLLYILHLDTFHCDRLYPLIVNKYNWQLLLDNVTLRTLFPDRTARSYQWYKDDLPIPGATDDDYSEQNELHGRFQLRIELDNNQTIWSNILEINVQRPTTNDQLQVHIFNCHGLPVREDQLTRGIYLYRYQQGDTVWTEKRLIP